MTATIDRIYQQQLVHGVRAFDKSQNRRP